MHRPSLYASADTAELLLYAFIAAVKVVDPRNLRAPGGGKTGDQKLLIYEQRLWSTNYPHNVDSGGEFYGTKGQMFLSRRGKIAVYGERNKRIEVKVTPEAQNAEKHVANFLHCVRTGDTPNGDIELGHLTTSLCHLGNVATRLGRSLTLDPETERIPDDKEADALLGRQYRAHWGTPKGVEIV